MNKNFHKIIKEICHELDIKYTLLSKDWIIMLEKGGVTKFISGYKFDNNGHALGNVLDDKYALFEVLSAKNIPIIEHEIMFKQSNYNDYATKNNTYDMALSYFQEHDKNIVLKSNTGTCGSEVFHVTDEQQCFVCLEKLLRNNFSISLCPFYDIKREYRVIMLDGCPLYSYGKIKPMVIGDGMKTVKQLLEEFNPHYFNSFSSFFNKDINPNYIPKMEEILEYNWQYNLSKGANIIEIAENKEKIEQLAVEIASKIGLSFASVDIIETNDDNLFVLEINSGVMLENFMVLLENGYEIAYNIYREAIIHMFH